MAVSLTDPKVFFEEIAKPNFDGYMETVSSFRTAFNAVTALFHLHEWIYESKRVEIETKYGQSFRSKGAFWKFVESQVSGAKFVRDLANASKHVTLKINPSTSMTHIANTTIQTAGYGGGGFGAGRFSAPSVVMKDGLQDVYLDGCLQDLFEFWRRLIADLYP
jgi:hypothetical protein